MSPVVVVPLDVECHGPHGLEVVPNLKRKLHIKGSLSVGGVDQRSVRFLKTVSAVDGVRYL